MLKEEKRAGRISSSGGLSLFLYSSRFFFSLGLAERQSSLPHSFLVFILFFCVLDARLKPLA
ncbi:hypothetical protein Scep_020666 [Stephania cephalantha]|uniref:Uncharacterized protein n=1 Tax=Stephania cephalantha TaxID=152367 RepID=A0AAP0IEB4_9MAGN